MSYICIQCEKTLILDLNAVNETTNQETPTEQTEQGDDTSKLEFLKVKNELIQELKDLLPTPKTDISENSVLCDKCLQDILSEVKKDLEFETTKKNNLQLETKILDEDLIKAEKKLKSFKVTDEEENKLRDNLQALIKKEQDQQVELDDLGRLQIDCETLEETYWEETLTFESKLFLLNERKNSADRQIKEMQNEIDRLSRINILNDLVHITTDHEVARVNDLQLGKMFNANAVNWPETNAALGQLVLLFAMLEYKCVGMKYERIKLRPQGSFSEIIRITNDKEEKYDLFGPPKDELRFNSGLFTLLDAMTQMHHFLASKLTALVQGGSYELSHKILGENIGGLPFKYHSSKLDKWTEVLKYFSLNCKHLIYFFSLYEQNSQIAMKVNFAA